MTQTEQKSGKKEGGGGREKGLATTDTGGNGQRFSGWNERTAERTVRAPKPTICPETNE